MVAELHPRCRERAGDRRAGAEAVGLVLDRLTDDDPRRRPAPDVALAGLVRLTGPRGCRPWPWWADRELVRPGRAAARGGARDRTGEQQRAR